MMRLSAFSLSHRSVRWRSDAERSPLFQTGAVLRNVHRHGLFTAALSYVRQQLAARGGMDGEVMLLERRADDFRDIEPNSFDAVILNSVVQYFPSVAYLLRVLEGAVSATRSGGFVFVGDVRSLPLLEAFHTSVELAKADDALSLEELRQIIRKRVADEEELILDPAFFVALKEHLPQISHVDILPKRARLQNEMTRFRYQVVIHVGEQTALAAAPAWIDYQHVANARTSDAVRALAMLERLETQPSESGERWRAQRDSAPQ